MAQSLSKIYILRIKAFALSGRGDSTMREPQGVASLALGYVLHWAFSPSLLNPKLKKYNLRQKSLDDFTTNKIGRAFVVVTNSRPILLIT